MIVIRIHTLDKNWKEFAGTEPSSFLEIEDSEMMSFPVAMNYELRASLVNGGVLVEGRVWTEIEAQCGRCLERFRREVVNDGVCHFYSEPEDDELDISEDLREDMVLMLPLNPLCNDDCKGLCLNCGADAGECSCGGQGGAGIIWGDLDKIKFEK